MTDRTRTLNGQFDARCVTCGSAVYRLWVSDEAPPPGCSDGYDAEPWRCSHVYNHFVMIVIAQDHTHQPIGEVREKLIARLGNKAAELMAHIRAGGGPEEWEKLHGKRRPPSSLPAATTH